MKSFIAILPTTFAVLLGLATPADALVMVMGNSLAHDCFEMAKAGVNNEISIATCDSALLNAPLDPHDRAGTYVNRGVIEIAMKRAAAAMEDYNQAIKIKPDLADAYVDRAAAFILERRFDEALADVNHGLELGPTYPFAGYYNRAVAEQLQGKLKEAYFDYKKTLELAPKFAPAEERLQDFTVTTVPADATPPN